MGEWRSWEVTNAEFREVLEDRTAKYAVEVFKYLRELPYDVSTKVIAHQLGKSASSIGANYHEANRSESRDDFVHKVAIAVKEANESCYWFKVLRGLCGSNERIEALAKETCELRNLLQSRAKKHPLPLTPPLPTPPLLTPFHLGSRRLVGGNECNR